MAKWFLGPIMEKLTEKLISTCSEYLPDQLRWQTGMKEELERLQENLPKIQAVVAAASQVYIIDQNSPLNKWIWQLRDAIDEAEDVLDDFEYMKHKEQLARNMARSTMGPIVKIAKRAFKIDSNLKRLQEIVHKLDKILAEANIFLYLVKDKKQEQQVQQDKLQNVRETGSMPKVALIGRDQYKESVIQWLGKLPNEEHQSHHFNIPNYNNISVLSIVGPGGMGKTTLLQHVYEGISTNDFDLKMWVCVSDNFNVKKVTADVLESLKKSRPNLESLDALQNSLKLEVMSKKFLLVMDDIWEKNEEQDKIKWENVLAPLAHGGLGSKILITTRMESAALMIAKVINKDNESLKIKGLDDAECLHLLNTHAFVGVKNLNEHNKLRSIAGELVTKLYGSPLAAKVLGGVLNSKLDERHWRNVLNNVLDHNGISSILELSYIFLPEYLQNCFAFCSIFAQDHIFDKDDLVRMWIAVGFIKPSRIFGETLEDIGERYFDMLVMKSFFDKYYEKYRMHDLLHELAQSVSAQECFRVVDDEDSERIPETIRHLSIKTDNLILLKQMRKFKNLRTLCITTSGRDNKILVDVLTRIFEENRSIRLLYIHTYGQKMILETVECLKHLRYLRLPNFHHDTLLPRSVSNLYHLQFLICGYSLFRWDMNNLSNLPENHDDFFPRDMNNLSNLRYLSLPHLKFPEIGKLKFLQELNGFEVKNESGYRIEELEHMTDLRILRIKGLENVTDVQEACNAKLCGKEKLVDLSLKWNATTQNSAALGIYARVLDNLQPHNNLQKLTMNGYMGVRSAIWMNNTDLISNLERIELQGCLEWQILPPFGQLPFLKSLHLRNIPKAERFGNIFHGNDMCCIFPSLEVLHIENLEALMNWFEAGVDCLFPCLTELYLYNCPNLQELPSLPPKLKKLNAKKIGWKTLNCCCSILGPSGTFLVHHCPNISAINVKWEIIGGAGVLKNVVLQDCPNLLSIGGHQEAETIENYVNLIVDDLHISDASVLQMEPMRSISSIKSLTIVNNDRAVSFPFEVERWFLQVSSSLHELYLKNLKSLQSLPSNLISLSSLEILCLQNIPLLKSLPDLPPSLRDLNLNDLKNLNSLPSCLPTLSSLTSLAILKVPHLRELPDLPPSLHKLKLEDLDNLNCLPSYFPSLYSLTYVNINNISLLLKSLQALPTSLGNTERLFSSLTKLQLFNCPNLQELPYLPPKLEELKAKKIGWKTLNFCCSILGPSGTFLVHHCPNISIINVKWKIIGGAGVLKNVELEYCPNLLSIGGHQEVETTENCVNLIVDELDISDASLLQMEPMRSITSIRRLTIQKNNGVASFPFEAKRWFLQVSSSLHELHFKNLKSLQSLPSYLTSLSSLEILRLENIPLLKSLPALPASLGNAERWFPSLTELQLYNCPNLQDLPYLPPKLKKLKAMKIGWKTLNCCCSILGPSGKFLACCCSNISTIKMNWENIDGPQEPGMLNDVELEDCPNLLSIGGHQEVETTENCLNLIVDELSISNASVLQMEPMRSITSVRKLKIKDNDVAASFPFEAEQWFLQVSSSLRELYFKNLKSLQSLSSSLTSLSSLEIIHLENIPLLKSLSYLPPSLRFLNLHGLDNLNSLPSCLPSLSSLTLLKIHEVPQLRELSDLPASLCTLILRDLDNLNCLPSCLPTLSSLTLLEIHEVHQLRELPDLPPSLHELRLYNLDNLNCLPSCLPSLSSLRNLYIDKVPQLRELPELPASLCTLILRDLDNLNCMPFCLPSLSSLTWLSIDEVPRLRELPDLPPSLERPFIYGCDPELMKGFKK